MARATPTNHAVTSTQVWPLLQIRPEFAPSVREKRKSSGFTSRYLHETGTRGAGDPVPAVLPGATQQPPCLRFAEGPPPTRPIFFGYAKKTYLQWEIPQEVASKLDDAKRRHS